MEFKVLHLENKPELLQLEQVLLDQSGVEGFEAQLASWHAPWREESLNHYLPLGWSFGIWSDEGKLAGYLLAQPVLFFQGLSQVLWVEHLAFLEATTAHSLVDIAYRWARDKHLQKVIFPQVDKALSPLLRSEQAQPTALGLIEIRTAKYV